MLLSCVNSADDKKALDSSMSMITAVLLVIGPSPSPPHCDWHRQPLIHWAISVLDRTVMLGKRVCVSDFEEEARKLLPKAVYDYYRSGADQQNTLADNVAAFNRYNTHANRAFTLRNWSFSAESITTQTWDVAVCVIYKHSHSAFTCGGAGLYVESILLPYCRNS